MAVTAAQLERQYPNENAQHGATLNGLQDEVSDRLRMLLVALVGAAICVLLIAHLANLLLARGLVRQKELAVRAALGAGRERLIRQLVTESLVLAVLEGVPGALGAFHSVPLPAKLVLDSLPMAQTPSVDWRVLTFAALLTVITGIGFGVIRALPTGGGVNLAGMREGVRAGGGQRETPALVIAEVRASVVLPVSAGSFLRALWRVQATDPGFPADGILTLRTSLPMPKYQSPGFVESPRCR